MNAEKIKAELEAAHHHDEQARLHKQQAGLLIHCAVAEVGKIEVSKAIGTDIRKVELLLNMAPLQRHL